MHDKIGLAYPLNETCGPARRRHLRQPLGPDVPGDARLIEEFGTGRLRAHPPAGDRSLARAINTYVMQDEARHVMFGAGAGDYYPQLTQPERDEREVLYRRLLPDA